MDITMMNHTNVSENSDEYKYLYPNESPHETIAKGGAIEDDKDRPTGGFPPIFIIDEAKEKEAEKIKNRQLTSTKTTVSIKDILKSKK